MGCRVLEERQGNRGGGILRIQGDSEALRNSENRELEQLGELGFKGKFRKITTLRNPGQLDNDQKTKV